MSDSWLDTIHAPSVDPTQKKSRLYLKPLKKTLDLETRIEKLE